LKFVEYIYCDKQQAGFAAHISEPSHVLQVRSLVYHQVVFCKKHMMDSITN